MSEEKTVTESVPVLGLPPVNKEQMDTNAFERYRKLLGELYNEVPLEQLSDGDLTEDEKAKRNQLTAGIIDWIKKCNKVANALNLNFYAYALSLQLDMSGLKVLLGEAYRRKNLNQRREWALRGINPPLDDAKIWLTKQEHQEFLASLLGVADAYLDGGEGCTLNDWHLDLRARPYFVWTGTIKMRKEREAKRREAEKEKEAERREAEKACDKYNAQINQELKALTKELHQTRMDPDAHFKDMFGQTDYSFSHILPEKEKKECNALITSLATKETLHGLQNFLGYVVEIVYYLLPRAADYDCEDIPSLDFGFLLFATAEVGYWLIPKKVEFNGWSFQMPWVDRGGYAQLLQKPEFLGYEHNYFFPEDLGDSSYFYWQKIPLILIDGLMRGDFEPDGCSVIDCTEGSTTYQVEGSDEGIAIPDDFAQYLGKIGTWKDMLSKGIITPKIAQVIKKAKEESTKLLKQLKSEACQAIVAPLEQMGYPKAKAEAAAKYAIQKAPNESVEEKVKRALNYLGG